MAKDTLTPEAVTAMNAIAAAFAPKKDKKEKAKFVMLVDGKIQSMVIPSMKDLKEAAMAITLNNISNGKQAPKIEYAEIVDTISVDVPLTASGESKAADSNVVEAE